MYPPHVECSRDQQLLVGDALDFPCHESSERIAV